MNVCDDGPYIRMAASFAHTGHMVYNGWAAAMMVAQVYLAQPFIKLFGYSYTSVRMSTLLLAVVTAFFFHRTLFRTGSSERNATLATLAVVLSPLYLMLSGTFMSDIAGLFAVTLCLYGCVRAMGSSADRSAIFWICFASFSCAIFGTSRQIAWLGSLVMVPCTLWLLRSRRHVVFAGGIATLASFAFILGCVHWLAKQPYSVPVPLIVRPFPKRIALRELTYIVLELPFLILPIAAAFIPSIFKARPKIRLALLVALCAYIALGFHWRHKSAPIVHLEPTAGNGGSWVTPAGVYSALGTPALLSTKTLMVLTVLSIGGLLGIIAVACEARERQLPSVSATGVMSWKSLGILLFPFSIGYLVLCIAAVGTTRVIFDRYAIGLLGPVAIALLHLYQEQVRPDLPLASVLLIALFGCFGIIMTHNTFALDRARVQLADEVRAAGVPYTSLDGGWDYNLDTELDNSDHLNNPLTKVPSNAYVVPPPAPAGPCPSFMLDRTPHVRPIYGVSLFPDSCYGEAPFAPVEYRPWPFRRPINLYVVRYTPPAGAPEATSARY